MRIINKRILYMIIMIALGSLPTLAMTNEEIAEQSKGIIPQQIREQEAEPLQTIPTLQAQEEIEGSLEAERKGTNTPSQESLLQESAATDQTGAIKQTDASPLQEREMGSNVLWHEREDIDNTKIINMVNSLHCQYIQSLILPGNPLGDEAASAIAQHLPNLISLDLSETNISNEGVREIARLLVNLRSLNLSYVLIRKSGAKEMGSNLTNLERLDLIACQLRPSACAKLAMGLPHIRSLNMEHNHFDHEGILSLFTKPHPSLSFLNLKFNGVTDIEILRLSSSQWFNKLRKLNLSHNPVEKFTLRYISKHLTDLTVLELSHNRVKDDQAIMMAENLHNLIRLNLESNEITDRGAIALAKAFFPQLRILNVLLNPIGEKGVKALEKLRRKTKGKAYVYWG